MNGVWTNIDFLIILVYFILMLGLSFWFKKFASTGMENFFLGGRRTPGWINGISYTSALVSPDAATAYGGLAVATGAFISWWYLSRFGLAMFLAGVLFAMFWRRLKLFTSLEFYDLRFSSKVANTMRIWIAVRTSFIAIPAWTGITLLAAYKILGPAFGLTIFQTLILVIPVSFIYVFFSGYRGVVVSNVIQMSIFLVGTIVVAVFTMKYFGSAVEMTATINRMYGDIGKEILQLVPPAKHEIFPSMAALAWLIGQSIGYGGDVAPIGGAMEGHRILSTRSTREAVYMYVSAALSMFLLLLLVTLPCISAAAIWPEFRDGAVDRELVYGKLMKEMLPSGALGLLIAAMLAATMSVVSDNLNFGGQIMVSDIYRRWFVRDKTEKHYLIIGKAAMLIIVFLSLLVVFKVKFIVDVAIFMLQISAAELPANWAQWWWWRFNGKARLAASFGGFIFFILIVLVPKLLLLLGWEWAHILIVPWWWQTLIIMLLTTILWVMVVLFTKPESEGKLTAFYQKALPLGWWKIKVSSGATDAERINIKPIIYGILIAILGFTATCCVILGLSDLWFANFLEGGILLGISALLFIAFKIFLKHYLDGLEKRLNKNQIIE
ncbi:sodium:solute symporter family transporter [Proteiniphilum acetatigenes]|uniref:sodium:solute symporter family transporter n=1 Tax=Proteiniphilum acetatigenes TaxID=294710 RepID=UPI000366ADA3|nr:hypothetical protein [Proteiniphilum acetatigenes]SFK89945.1 Na+/proline symporter [Porphyromonadaceae bacterium KH3CP3RA]